MLIIISSPNYFTLLVSQVRCEDTILTSKKNQKIMFDRPEHPTSKALFPRLWSTARDLEADSVQQLKLDISAILEISCKPQLEYAD